LKVATQDITTEDNKIEAEKILASKLGEAQKKEESIEVPKETPQDDIEKPVRHKEWHFVGEYDVEGRSGAMEKKKFDRTYIQKPLSYMAFGEFTGLLGRRLEEAMQGPSGISLDRILPGEENQLPLSFVDGKLSVVKSDFAGIDPFLQGFAKLSSYIPELLGEAQCIWLRVPRSERFWLTDIIWPRPVDEGGLSMDEGEEMMSLFIEQNYDELEDFLPRLLRLRTKWTLMRNRKKKVKGN
jgi:hypothetical protein